MVSGRTAGIKSFDEKIFREVRGRAMAKHKKMQRAKSQAVANAAAAAAPSASWLWLVQSTPVVVVGVAFLFLAFRFFGMISDFAVNIFFSDQWDFDEATLFQRHSLWQMFAWQHGPHRQGAGALLGWLVEPLFHWNSRSESFFIGGIVAAATLGALWLKKRLFGGISYSDVIIPLVFFSPLQYETLFVTANLAHGPLPLLFLVLYCLAWTCPGLRLRYTLVLIINFLAIFTGFGFFLGLLTPLCLMVDYRVNLRETQRGLAYFVTAFLISLASLGIFFLHYKMQPAADCFTIQVPATVDYVQYMVLMFAPFFGVMGTDALPTLIGSFVVCILLTCFIFSAIGLWRARGAQWTRRLVIATLTAFCLMFSASTAYGRLCLGMSFSQSSRYAIYLHLGLLGIYFSLLSVSGTTARRTVVAIFGFALLGTFVSGERLRGDMVRLHEVKHGWKQCYLLTGSVDTCDQYTRVHPEPQKTRLQEKLDFLRKTRQNLFDNLQD
jgi:hypothetical protein